MRWKIYKLQRTTKLISLETAQEHRETHLKEVAMHALLAYQNREQKKTIQFTFARGHRSECLKRTSMAAFTWYLGERRRKRALYERAKEDRRRIKTQNWLLKLLKVATYWRERSS